MDQARWALSANSGAAPSATCSQAAEKEQPAAAGDLRVASLGARPHDTRLHTPQDHPSCSSERATAMADFQRRLTPLVLHPGSGHQPAQPAPPLVHSSQQSIPEQSTAPQQERMSSAHPTAAEQQMSVAQLGAAAVGMLDDMLLASPVPAAVASLSLLQPSAAALERQPEQWSPKATVASLASLRHSAPALVMHLHGTPVGSSSALCSRSGPAGVASTPMAQLGRMLRQAASLGSRQLDSSLATYQELAAARKLRAAYKEETGLASSSVGLIPACYSVSSTPASTLPNSACLRPGELL